MLGIVDLNLDTKEVTVTDPESEGVLNLFRLLDAGPIDTGTPFEVSLRVTPRVARTDDGAFDSAEFVIKKVERPFYRRGAFWGGVALTVAAGLAASRIRS